MGHTLLITLGFVAIAGCSSPRSNGILFGGTVTDTKAYLDNYTHVLLVCATTDRVTDTEHPARSERHFGGTVVHVYKGDWRVSDSIAWAHELDFRMSPETNKHVGELFFVFTNERASKEMYLDTGDWPRWDKELARQVEIALK